MKAAIGYVQPDHAYMLYNTGSVWTETMAPALVSGKSVDDAWGDFDKELNNQAKAMGYTIK
jgi:multiple sugar transport system substrate-binding protein